MSTSNPMQGVLTSLFETSTEKGGEISRQFNPFMFEFHQFLDLPQDKKDQITQIVLDTMKKLSRLGDCVDRYHEFEKEEEKKLIEKVKNDKSSVLLVHAAHSDKLEGAIEDVLSYSKASLDVAVKVLEPIFGVKLHTYGEKGEKVINALRRNVPKDQHEHAEKLIKVIAAFKPYIEPVIKQRVQAQHYGNVRVTAMTVAKSKNGKFKTELPRVSKDQFVKDFLEIAFTNNFGFLTEFFAFSLAAKFFGGLIPVIANDTHPRIRVIKVGISPDSIKSQ